MTRLAQPPTLARPGRPRMTYQEFLTSDFGDEHVEWVDGEVVEMAAATVDHAGINGFLFSAMRILAEQRKLGQVFADPFQMKTGPDLPGRAPDVLFVATRNLKRLRTLYLEGPADLVIEVVSPSSRTTDRVHKYREYESGGVPEYWVIDQEFERAEFFRLDRSGRYKDIPVEDGIARSRSMKGFWVRTEWLWSPPPLLVALRELGVLK